VLSSDALSSVAYATEEVLRVLMLGGLAAMGSSQPISILIAVLLLAVAFSFRQTIFAFPQGGGAYVVTKCLPDSGAEPEYRIRSANEPYERVARESELTKA
jgi:hypothetical protein